MTETAIHPWQERDGVPCLSCGPAPGGCAHCRGSGVAYDVQRAEHPRTLVHAVKPTGGGELWQGGFTCLSCRECPPRSGTRYFGLVVDLWSPPGSGSPRTQHVRYPIHDGVISAGEMDAVRLLAAHVAREVAAGERVLVRCQWGLNRSGLVVGLALRELGIPGPEAVALIRSRRSPWAISNRLFYEEVTR